MIGGMDHVVHDALTALLIEDRPSVGKRIAKIFFEPATEDVGTFSAGDAL
jgi:hypothetical protein